MLADRTHHFDAPTSVLYSALTTEPQSWLHLAPGEVLPAVLDAVSPTRVVWSSFWPASPDDTVVLDLESDGESATSVRFRWFTCRPPDARGVGITRRRLNKKIGGDLRSVVSEYYWASQPATDP